MTRIDLTKAQCAELANYLRGILNNGMGAGSFDKIEMLVLARRALAAAEELPEVSVPPIPPLSLQTPPRRPLFPGAVRRKLRSSSARRWRGWRLIAGQTASPALRRWRSCVMKWTAKLSPRRCWAECSAGRGFR